MIIYDRLSLDSNRRRKRSRTHALLEPKDDMYQPIRLWLELV